MSAKINSMIFEVWVPKLYAPGSEIIDAAITILSVFDEWQDIAIVGHTTMYNDDNEADETHRDVPLISVPADVIVESPEKTADMLYSAIVNTIKEYKLDQPPQEQAESMTGKQGDGW